jgi:uncharacterized protein
VAPVAPGERLTNLDVVRAVALFGVLMVNLLTEFRVSIFEQFLGPPRGMSSLDAAIDAFTRFAVESKAFVLFSFLFGVGLAIQSERRGQDFARHVARRQAALLAIGVVHLVLVWNGDILTEYAIAGLLMAPLVRRSRNVLLVAAGALLLLYVAPLPYPQPFSSAEALEAHVEAATRAYAGGGFGEVLAFRVHELRPIGALELLVLPRTMALFALGAWAHASGVFARPAEHARLLRSVAAFGTTLGAAASLQAVRAPLGPLADAAESLAPVALGLGYAAALVLVAPRLAFLAPLGRMALTSYIAQSILFGFLFYGYGLGWFGRVPVARAALLGVVVYAAQAALAALWLRRFRFGPLEWLWRSATYGAWQPLR